VSASAVASRAQRGQRIEARGQHRADVLLDVLEEELAESFKCKV
jgi:hypothetical protein